MNLSFMIFIACDLGQRTYTLPTWKVQFPRSTLVQFYVTYNERLSSVTTVELTMSFLVLRVAIAPLGDIKTQELENTTFLI